MQKILNFFFVHYFQKQFNPLNTCLLGKLHQYPSDIRNLRSARDVLSAMVGKRFLLPPSLANSTEFIFQ